MYKNIIFTLYLAGAIISLSIHAMGDQMWLPCNQVPTAVCSLPVMPQPTTVVLPTPRPMSPGALTRKVLELEQQNRTYQLVLQEQAALIREQTDRTAEQTRSIATLMTLPEQIRVLRERIGAFDSGIAGLAQQTLVTELKQDFRAHLLAFEEQATHVQQQAAHIQELYDKRNAEQAKSIAMLMALPQRLDKLQSQIAGHGTGIAEHGTRFAVLAEQCTTMQQGIATQEHSMATYAQQISALQGQVAGTSKGIAEHGTWLAAFAGRLAAMEAKSVAQEQSIAKHSQQVGELQGKVAGTSKDIAVHGTRLAALDGQVLLLQRRIAEREQYSAINFQKIDELQVQLTGHTSKWDSHCTNCILC